jgi:hypothetical protein
VDEFDVPRIPATATHMKLALVYQGVHLGKLFFFKTRIVPVRCHGQQNICVAICY